jgi:hypothetical protein
LAIGECRSYAPNQKLGTVSYGEKIIDHRYGAISDEALDPSRIDDGRFRVSAVKAAYLREVHGHIAHDPLDDLRAATIDTLARQLGRRSGSAR